MKNPKIQRIPGFLGEIRTLSKLLFSEKPIQEFIAIFYKMFYIDKF